MADKYCIASGSYKDTSIWSTERDGEGGAGVPSISDNVFFTKDVTVTDFTNVLSFNRVFTIEPGVHVVLECTDTTGIHFARSSVVDVQSQARLDFISPPAVTFSGKATLRIAVGAEVHVLSEPTLYEFRENAILDNAGLFDTGNSPIVFDTTNATNNQNFGNTKSVATHETSTTAVARCFRSFGSGASFHTLTFGRTVEEGTPNYPQNIFLGSPTEILEKLSFENPLDDIVHYINQSSSLTILGDIESGTGPVTWAVDKNVSSSFIGTGNQNVAMPKGSEGQEWRIRKFDESGSRAGTLDLQYFVGTIKGESRANEGCETLVVREASTVTIETITFDTLEVYGNVVIPAGCIIETDKVICHEGGTITGDGLLIYGNSEDAKIDPANGITVRAMTMNDVPDSQKTKTIFRMLNAKAIGEFDITVGQMFVLMNGSIYIDTPFGRVSATESLEQRISQLESAFQNINN